MTLEQEAELNRLERRDRVMDTRWWNLTEKLEAYVRVGDTPPEDLLAEFDEVRATREKFNEEFMAFLNKHEDEL